MAKRKTPAKAKKPAARKTKAAGKSPKRAARPAGARARMGMGGTLGTVSDLELAVWGITLDPDPPVHDQAFTVSFSFSPSTASTTVEVFVNGVAQMSSSAR